MEHHQPSSACSFPHPSLAKSHKSPLEIPPLDLSCPGASRANSMILHVLKLDWHLGSDMDRLCLWRASALLNLSSNPCKMGIMVAVDLIMLLWGVRDWMLL